MPKYLNIPDNHHHYHHDTDYASDASPVEPGVEIHIVANSFAGQHRYKQVT